MWLFTVQIMYTEGQKKREWGTGFIFERLIAFSVRFKVCVSVLGSDCVIWWMKLVVLFSILKNYFYRMLSLLLVVVDAWTLSNKQKIKFVLAYFVARAKRERNFKALLWLNFLCDWHDFCSVYTQICVACEPIRTVVWA